MSAFSQGTLASLTATYGKYKGYRSASSTPHKNIHKLLKDNAARSSPQQQFDPRAVRTPVKKTSEQTSRPTATLTKKHSSITSQNPVSPPPNRPPRPTAQGSSSASKPRQQASGVERENGVRFVQSKSQSNVVGENQDTNSMSIQ